MIIYGDGRQAKDLIHVEDAIEITFRLLESDATGIYNVGTGIATSFNRLSELIGGPVEYVPNPNPRGYQYFTEADTSKLHQVIGDYQFIPVEDGIKTLI
jgi:ADP-L-glycero-D-manno-heptose 6-epimerase